MAIEKYNMVLTEITKYYNYKEIEIDEYIKNIDVFQKEFLEYITNNNNSIEITNISEIFKRLFYISYCSLNILEIKLNKNVNEIMDNNKNLFINKNRDYGNSFEDFGFIGILIRLNDKINRLKTICKNKNTSIDEKVEDTINDLYNYCVIGLMYK